MKRMVKETLHEGKEEQIEIITKARKSVAALQAVKTYCEDVISDTEYYFEEIANADVDENELDSDEAETYVANEAIQYMANKILNIINK